MRVSACFEISQVKYQRDSVIVIQQFKAVYVFLVICCAFIFKLVFICMEVYFVVCNKLFIVVDKYKPCLILNLKKIAPHI